MSSLQGFEEKGDDTAERDRTALHKGHVDGLRAACEALTAHDAARRIVKDLLKIAEGQK